MRYHIFLTILAFVVVFIGCCRLL